MFPLPNLYLLPYIFKRLLIPKLRSHRQMKALWLLSTLASTWRQDRIDTVGRGWVELNITTTDRATSVLDRSIFSTVWTPSNGSISHNCAVVFPTRGGCFAAKLGSVCDRGFVRGPENKLSSNEVEAGVVRLLYCFLQSECWAESSFQSPKAMVAPFL